MNRRILIATLLVALAVLLNNWLSGKREESRREKEEAGLHVPDYFLRDFTATTMNSAGRPDQRLQAALMQHFGDDGSMELTQPRLTLYANDKGGEPWQISAARGQVRAGGREVVLSGDVRMHRSDNGQELELQTDNMLIRPQQRYAQTDAPVTVTAPQGRMTAVGLRAFLTDQRLELLSRVRGDYVPPQH